MRKILLTEQQHNDLLDIVERGYQDLDAYLADWDPAIDGLTEADMADLRRIAKDDTLLPALAEIRDEAPAITPESLRQMQQSLVATVPVTELFEHPLIKTTPQGGVIAIMAINSLLEALAQQLEGDEHADTEADAGSLGHRSLDPDAGPDRGAAEDPRHGHLHPPGQGPR